jgi:glycosyltransferase involved in cell wall biosynthesis
MREPVEAAGYRAEEIGIRQVALSAASSTIEAFSLAKERLRAVWSYRKIFQRHRIDIVYVNSSVQIAPMLAAISLGLKLIVHVREGWNTGWTFPLKRFCVRTLAHGALFDARKGMRLFGGQPRGRRWIFSPNGVAPHLRDPERRAATRETLGLADDEIAFLFLGTLIQRKGLHDLVECWPDVIRAAPKARLLVAGLEERTENHPAIRSLIAGEVKKARYLGFRRDVYDLLEAADFFVLPSYGEAMPISICESMMAGTPVIARTAGDVAWLLREGRGYPFSGRGAESVKTAIMGALSDKDVGGKAARARTFAQRRLHRDVQRRQIINLLESI